MDAAYRIIFIIKNKNIEEEYKDYGFSFKIKNNKLVFNYLLPKLSKPNQILKLIIGNKLYFNIENNGYYNANISKTNYEIIKKYNKVIIELDTSCIISIIKNNKLYNNQYYNFYLVKKDKELNLFFINDNIVNVYKYINNEFILQKKFICYREFLVDENDNLFYFYYYEILPITKKFKYYNYIINLVKYKYKIFKEDPSFNKYLIDLYNIYYLASNNNNEIKLTLKYIYFETNSVKYENNKIELIGKNRFLLII